MSIAERLRQGVDPDDIPETERAMDAGAAEIEQLRGLLSKCFERRCFTPDDIDLAQRIDRALEQKS